MDEVARLREQVQAARDLAQQWRSRHSLMAHVRAADELDAVLDLPASGPSTDG